MEQTSTVDGYVVHCSAQLVLAPYFAVSWTAKLDDDAHPTVLHTESYICRADSEKEALDRVCARAHMIVRYLQFPYDTLLHESLGQSRLFRRRHSVLLCPEWYPISWTLPDRIPAERITAHDRWSLLQFSFLAVVG